MVYLREDKTVAKTHDAALQRVPNWSYVYENGRMVRTDKYKKSKNNYKF